jgi:hypothetical protein
METAINQEDHNELLASSNDTPGSPKTNTAQSDHYRSRPNAWEPAGIPEALVGVRERREGVAGAGNPTS